MEDIKQILEKQLEVSKEINLILSSVNEIEEKEKQILYDENKRLIEEINLLNDNNIELASDRINKLKRRVSKLLNNDEGIEQDSMFRRYLMNVSIELNNLNTKINDLNKEFDKRIIRYEEKVTSTDLNKNSHTEKRNKQYEKSGNKTISNNTDNYKKMSAKTNTEFEFKIGSVLNVIGVIMILIALVTFGKYIYTNYMTNTLKGIFLFIISTGILVAGESIFTKKVPKFALGLSALGVGCLYASIVINFLVLYTINSLVAIIITMVVTGISLFISKNKNSNVIRIVGLLGAYICFIPSDDLSIMHSYITVVMLLIISISNIYIPIKDKYFSIYSSILNALFCIFITSSEFLYSNAAFIYLITTIISNSLMYINLCKDTCEEEHRLACIITTVYLIGKPYAFIENQLLIEIINIFIAGMSYYMSKNKLKNVFYCQGVIIYTHLMLEYLYDFTFIYSIAYALLIGLTLYMMNKDKDIYLKGISVLLIIFGLVEFMTVEPLLAKIVYFVLFSIIIWLFSDKYKNYTPLITLKHAFFAITIFKILCSDKIDSITIAIFLASIIAIIYILINNNIERLRDDYVKGSNIFILVSVLIVINLFAMNTIVNCLISIAISISILILLTNSKYIEEKGFIKYNILVYSLYTTYAIFRLLFNSNLPNDINNLILSIVLMLFAFINVWIGFKLNKVEVRKYGLILSLLICAKLILIDFNSYDFIIKTILFLIVGVVALIISYIYSKLEQELNNKENIKNNK